MVHNVEKLSQSDINTCSCDQLMETMQSEKSTVCLFTEGDDLFNTMISEMELASSDIKLETYILADDEIGQQFVKVMIRKAQSNINVRLLVDAVGSLFQFSHIAPKLEKAGVKIQYFHRWHWRKPLRYNRRDHRKLLVIDNKKAFLGGFNIHKQSSLKYFGSQRWRDTHAMFQGPLANQAAELFDAFWIGNKRYSAITQSNAINFLVPNQSRACRQRLACIYDEALGSAKNKICLTTPYFVPDHRTQKALLDAVRRGVDVNLLVPRNSDVRVARWAANAVYAHLLEAGVKIFEYLPRMLHAKVIIVDEKWATLGTANLDYRSLFQNYELNLITRDRKLCHTLLEQFENDIKQASIVCPKKWQQRAWAQRLAELIGWSVRRWL